MKTLLTLLFSILIIQCYGQIKHQKLIVAEYRIDSPRVGNYTYLVSYNFENGILISKDTIFGTETFRKDDRSRFSRYVRFDLGTNLIYKNRYVISGSGNVIDIHKKALVIEEGDDFLEASGDTLIFHRANAYTGTGFLMLDLISGNYNFINNEELDQDKIRRSSPDKRNYLSIDQSAIPYKIRLHDLSGKKETVVFDAGHGPNITSGGQRPTIETFWLNNHSFLYAVHKIGILDSSNFNTETRLNSNYSTVTLRFFEINFKTDKQFYILDSVKQGNVNGRFSIDGKGQILYRTSGFKYFLVDTISRTLVPYSHYEFGKGFSIQNYWNENGNILKFYDKEIGRINPSENVVSNGIIAIREINNVITVWSEVTNSWITIEVPWINRLIGWIEDE